MASRPFGSTSPLAAAASNNASAVPLPDPSSPAISFSTLDDLFDDIDQIVGDILVVYDVSSQIFDEINREREKRGRKFRIRRFMAQSQLLIISIPTDVHEKLHTWVYGETDYSIRQMGLADHWNTMGSKTVRARGHPNGDGGEGDSSGGPKPQRALRGAWPTLVIEAGDTENLPELRTDMRWWFSTSDHEVKIVLLAKFDRGQMQIILEKWVEVQMPPRPGATTTRAASQSPPALVPTCSQIITIVRNPDVTDADPHRFHSTSYTVTRDALRLEFSRLFMREARSGEGDIVISMAQLQVYAANVWMQL